MPYKETCYAERIVAAKLDAFQQWSRPPYACICFPLVGRIPLLSGLNGKTIV